MFAVTQRMAKKPGQSRDTPRPRLQSPRRGLGESMANIQEMGKRRDHLQRSKETTRKTRRKSLRVTLLGRVKTRKI
ncbi:MAG: hypothetical protein GSR77_04770 [Desulfurococcales archaeon]|nr:hypothetical protein [Desulfurococcales archaeon]